MSVSGWGKVRLAAVAAAILAVGMGPARAQASDEARLLSLTNQVRSSEGLSALALDAQLTRVAQAWATTLAGRGTISHNSSLPSQVSGWKILGENVGVGGTVEAVHDGFVASPTHHENLVESAFTRVGFGIVRPDARIFVVEVFMQPASAASASSASSPASVGPAQASPATAAPGTTATTPATTPPVATTVPPAVPASSQGASGGMSPWLVNSLDRLRSMEPAQAA